MRVQNGSSTRIELSPAKQLLLKRRLEGGGKGVEPEVTIPRCERSGTAPLSFAQQRLWFLDQLAPGTPVYNISESLRLKGTLDIPALEQSLKEIVRRHEAVRTTFRAVEGRPVQIISSAAELILTKVDLSHLPAEDREEETRAAAVTEAKKPFDLTSDLMLRACLFRLEAEDHLLVLTLHHIASDAWSLGVLYRELSLLYGAFINGRPPLLPELPIQYQDFADWQRQWLQGAVLEKQLAYWKQQLANAPDYLELPTDHPRPLVQGFRGLQEWRILPAGLARQLNNLSRQEGVTLFMTLLGAFQTLLHRYTGQTDILIGSPSAGRTQLETEDLIGFFINTLVLRAGLSGNPSFRTLLNRVRNVTLEAYAHQDLPLEKLVMELRPERSSNHTPLFQVMFVLQSAPTHALELGALSATPVEVYTETAKFELLLVVIDTPQGLAAGFEYNRDLFDAPTIKGMLSHFQTLLEGIVADPNQPLSSLPLLTSAERHQLLVEWNDTRTNYPREKTVSQLFEEQVEQSPESIAVQHAGQQLTYRELNARANQLAHYLRKSGVESEMMVPICLERSVDLIVGLLAILKAGGAYAALDPTYPRERLASMLEDLRPPVLLTSEKLLASLSHLPSVSLSAKENLPLMALDAQAKAIAGESKDNLRPGSTAEGLAYVSFTSGSTGRPKGVCIPHRGVVRLVKDTNYTSISSTDVFLQLAPVPFDASTFEIWGPLLNGARLVICPAEAPSLAEVSEAIQKFGVTKLWLTAGLFHEMVDAQSPGLRTLRQLLAGGDVLSVPHLRKALESLSGCQIINGYGPTENTTFTCCHRINAESLAHRSVPIGRPISNSQVYVLDDHLQPVPIGVPGELHIGGDGLARGYLRRPELTTEKFIPNPFSSDPGARLYKTGDLVRYLPEGEIQFLGRMDQQVKIRGFRIEPGDIESILEQHPAVRQCVITVRLGASGEKQLAAYFVPAQKQAPTPSELRQFLSKKLPDYMVPLFFVPLTALPLTPQGKVDHAALAIPARANGIVEKKHAAPRDALEAQLTRIWESVLGIHPIGLTDQFFELGGHSLMAVRLIAQVEKVFGKKLSVAAVFQAPTVAQLAVVLRAGKSSVSNSSLVEIQPKGSKPPLFFVHGVGGGMFWGYTNLSRHLGLDQPVYALRSRGLAEEEEFGRIEDMAAHYVADVRSFQPEGPYYLGGYCFGGNVAYEMAQQLRAQGQSVAFLGLINAGPPNSSYGRISWTPLFMLKFLRNLCFWPSYVLSWTPEQRRGFFRWKARLAKKRIFLLFSSPLRSAPAIDVENLVDLSMYPEEQRKLWEIHIRALVNYLPKPYAGGVTLFRSRVHQFLCSYDPEYGWGELVKGGVTVKVISGPHDSILEEPHVRTLASELRTCLDRAQRADGSFLERTEEPFSL